MECWGASGGKLYGSYEVMSTGGRGGYTKGIITLTTARLTSYPTLYVYVGQKGADWNGPDNPSASCPVAWNGGGSSYISGLSGCATHSSGWTFDGAVTYSGTVTVYTASGPTGNNTTIPDPAKNEGNLLAYTKYSVHGYARIILKPYD